MIANVWGCDVTIDPSKFSLADFFLGDSDDPIVPPDDFVAWREATTWATSLYEPRLHAAATPRPRPATGVSSDAFTKMVIYIYLWNSMRSDTIPEAIAAPQEYGTG